MNVAASLAAAGRAIAGPGPVSTSQVSASFSANTAVELVWWRGRGPGGEQRLAPRGATYDPHEEHLRRDDEPRVGEG